MPPLLDFAVKMMAMRRARTTFGAELTRSQLERDGEAGRRCRLRRRPFFDRHMRCFLPSMITGIAHLAELDIDDL